uniref:NOP14 nucleolar protein homolog (yeast) n=1 Tax=Astyanax mexicanus TaxID=7994 RepID=A0A8B9HJC0_ASTMX
MGKPPKKRSLADKVRKTKTSTQIKNNPFEVKINRKKFDVLGQKSKHDVGLPGVSRSKAINKRKNTLLKEFRLKNKANKFVDRRFGEYDTKMAPEDKILKRFTMERQRSQTKKDLYNLNEEEELTHYGQSLAEMEKMTDMVDSDSDSEEKGLLSGECSVAVFLVILNTSVFLGINSLGKLSLFAINKKYPLGAALLNSLSLFFSLSLRQVYSLCQLFPASACKVMQTLLSDGGHSMEEAVEVKGRAAFPGLDMLIYLKIAALLFPTSDFRHPVTTPAFLYISQALTKCPVSSLESVSAGLVLCCLAVEFVSLSKRFIPELINFLLGLLHLAVPADTCKDYCVVSPFRQQGKASKLLLLCDTESSSSWSRKPIPLTSVHRVTASTDLQRDHHRLSVLDACLDLVKRCATLYRDLPSYDQIFQPIRTLLTNHLPVQSYPPALQELQREILEAIPETPSQHSPLVFDKKKPIALKMLQPKIVEVLDYGKKRGNTKEEKERERLKHKYKKEFKGALRELRKDTRFLAQAKLSDIMSRDAERKRKVKELYGSLATQEGEWKALKRKKRK